MTYQMLVEDKWARRRCKFFKFCRCGNKFKPHGKRQKLCDDCLEKVKRKLT